MTSLTKSELEKYVGKRFDVINIYNAVYKKAGLNGIRSLNTKSMEDFNKCIWILTSVGEDFLLFSTYSSIGFVSFRISDELTEDFYMELLENSRKFNYSVTLCIGDQESSTVKKLIKDNELKIVSVTDIKSLYARCKGSRLSAAWYRDSLVWFNQSSHEVVTDLPLNAVLYIDTHSLDASDDLVLDEEQFFDALSDLSKPFKTIIISR